MAFSDNSSQSISKIALERSRKFHAIKLKAVCNRIMALKEGSFFERSEENFLTYISKCPAETLVSFGSDFFWASAHRLYNAFDAADKKVVEIFYSFFLQNAFDSFFKILPAGSYLRCANFGDDTVILIVLDVCLYCSGNDDPKITITKKSNSQLHYRVEDVPNPKGLVINLNTPGYYRIAQGTLENKTKLLYQRYQNLFDNSYHYECSEDRYLGGLFCQHLSEALKIVALADKSIYDKLSAGIDYVIPMGNHSGINHPSFSSALLKRTIFLSLDLLNANVFEVAENMIHEFAHCELHIIQDTIKLTKGQNKNRLYYSPWRTDPRPLLGLFHGIYVFHQVALFYWNCLQTSNQLIDDATFIKSRLVIITHQLGIALNQISQNELTTFAAMILEKISVDISDIFSSFHTIDAVVPSLVIIHQETWQNKRDGVVN